MRLLLDTHAFLWWIAGDPALSPTAHDVIAEDTNEVLVSAASAWEIATKYRLGKLPGAAPLAIDIAAAVGAQGFVELPMMMRHARLAGQLPGPHKDPFDRMLIAQATLESLILVSKETVFDAYHVQRFW